MQPEYNLYDLQQYEAEFEHICKQNTVSVITFYSLASGFLTGKYRSDADLSKSARGGSVKKYLNGRGFRIVKALEEVAGRHNTTPASVAIAWLIARPGITAPIASATTVAQLNETIAAVKLNLTGAEIDLLNTASAY
ncbi:aldo/keto reductase [Mucilaginibacter antarcticus]|uniref:Aldo/keto reductase n=1 Tax=Mucilaginibacter antarcticus TaxID=1855725 RepID=A0ABW5XUI4_9SPHI